MLVYLILLVYRHPDETVNRLMIHPGYDASPPNRLGAFNTVTADGRRWLAATCDFLASRWSDPAALHGRAVGYIVGNEVNSHWFWSNRGRTSLAEFAADYEPAVRIVHESVRRHAAWARVYLSLEHHWNIRYEAADDGQAFAARPFLEEFARLARQCRRRLTASPIGLSATSPASMHSSCTVTSIMQAKAACGWACGPAGPTASQRQTGPSPSTNASAPPTRQTRRTHSPSPCQSWGSTRGPRRPPKDRPDVRHPWASHSSPRRVKADRP